MDTATNIASMERQRAPAEQGRGMTDAEAAAWHNRYNLAYGRLEHAVPRAVGSQVLDAIEATDAEFDFYLADAIKRGDEKLVGKLVLTALHRWRHRRADEEASE